MKKTLKIFTSDIKNILKNKIALIIVCGLLVLPSLYAWFNIYASWDPYGNTGGITVVVCNNDLGGKMKDRDINIGKDLVENLKENHTLGWTFVDDPDKAIGLARTGEVYASIIIPKDFSQKMSTIIDDNPMKPSLEYYVNEKINAISPKITDKGASTLQNKISTAFVESVTDQIFAMLKDVGIKTQDVSPILNSYKEHLDNLTENIPVMIQRLNDNAETVDSGSQLVSLSSKDIDFVDNVLKDLVSFTNDFKTDIDAINNNADEISRDLVETLNLTKTCLEDLDNNTVKFKEKIVLDKPNIVDTLNESSVDLKTIIKDMRSIQRSLKQFDKDISPEIEGLVKIIENQLTELETLLEKMSAHDLNNDVVNKLTKSIHELNSKIKPNLLKLDNLLQDNYKTNNAEYNYIQAISNSLSDLFVELEDKAETTERAAKISDDILIDVQSLKNEITFNKSPLLKTLNSIEENIKNLNANYLFEESLSNLKSDHQKLEKYKTGFSALNAILETSSTQVDSAISTIDSIDSTATSINNDVNKSISSFEYYTHALEKDISKSRKNLNKIDRLIANEKNALIPLVNEITNISLNRLEDVSNQLSDLSNDIKNNDVEKSLDNMHNLNSNIISNLDTLIIKLNTDLTATVKRYLSSASNFSSDVNILLVSITEKTSLMKDFSNKLAHSGQATADDMIKLSQKLPELQEDLIRISTKIENFNEKINIQKFINKYQFNENAISDFIAYPVDLNSHSLYSTDYYGCSMTPFYTVLSLWVGVLVLSSLLSTKSKNVDFKPTPLQNYLGKYPLFAILAVLQGLIVSLGDLFLLKVTAVEPVLLVVLSMFLSLVFCTIIYTLISLFGNVGKAMGVVLLVLQVAGSGGTFPIQMTPPFFQKLYAWLPFTYGIGALREAVFGVLYTSLKKDILILFSYFIVFLIVGILFVSVNHKHIEKITHKLEESGITE
ncbi:YhgE/Pip family protein [Brassicibacter mesophilus]|uniref:YhgE/Pip domain-containing protein n=1 Tax=Brassicibacter mesophilus TaxID=745119 RepID=UPI003D20E4E4